MLGQLFRLSLLLTITYMELHLVPMGIQTFPELQDTLSYFWKVHFHLSELLIILLFVAFQSFPNHANTL